MTTFPPGLFGLALVSLSVFSGCGAAPSVSQGPTASNSSRADAGQAPVSAARRQQALAALPSGYESLAIHERFSASSDRSYVRSGIRVLRVDAEAVEAFRNSAELQAVVISALQEAEAKPGVQPRAESRESGRAPARPPASAPARAVQVVGFHGGTQVYWGSAAGANDWQLAARFNLATALEDLQSIPSDMSGLMELSHRLQAQKRATASSIPDYQEAVAVRARALLGGAKTDFEDQAQRLGEAQGLAAVRAMEERASQVLAQIGLVGEAGVFKQLADAEIGRRVESQLRAAERQLREQPADSVLTTLDLGAVVHDLGQTLHRYGAAQGAQKLDQLVSDQIAKRLEGEALRAAFVAELQAFDADSNSLSGLLAMARDLEDLESSQPALGPYVDAVTSKIGEVLDASLVADRDSVERAGKGIFDVPDLLAEIEDLAAWYSVWGAEDLADEIRRAGLVRIAVLAEQSYGAYARDIGQREVARASARQIEEEIDFFRRYSETIVNSAEYVAVASAALGRMQSQLSADLLQRLGLPLETRGLGISVAGRRVDIGTFADNLSTAGHELIGVKAGSGGANAVCLTSLTIATKDGVVMTIGGGPAAGDDVYFSGDLLRVNDAEEELYPTEWISLMLQLGAVVPSGKLDAAGITDSDRFAGDPLDPLKVVEQGIFVEEIVHDVALEACLLAIEENPEVPRFYYHAGRTLLAMGELGEARTFLERAHADAYPAAAFALGGLELQSIMSAADGRMPKMSQLRRAKELFESASARGYTAAADQVTMVSELMAGMAPKFAEGCKKPDLLEAVYSGDIEGLLRAPDRTKTNYRYYFSSLRSAVAAKHRGFQDSSLNRDINSHAPQVHRDAQEFEAAVAEGGLEGLLKGMKKYQDLGERALGDKEVWKVDPSYPRGAQWDGMMLMMYIGHDDEELYRVFAHVLDFLRRAQK